MCALRQIGCVEESLVRVIRRGRKIFETDKATIDWDRVTDAFSRGTYTIPTSCCPPTIHAIADYVEHERNGIVEWAGYITRPEFNGDILTLEANDLLLGYDRRIIKVALDHVDVDLSEIFTDYAAAASEFDELPILLTPTDSGILGTRTVTTAEQRIAWSAMKELLDIGLDVTTVGLRAFVGPLDAATLPPIRISERIIKGGLQPKLGEDGLPYANRIVVKGSNGLVGVYPPGTPERPNESYPLIEAVVDASGDVEDQESLDQMALDQWSIRSQVPTFMSMDDAISLKESTPYLLSELIAGRLANLSFDSVCGLIQQAMRLATVKYNFDGSIEKVQVELAPAGLVANADLVVT